MSNDESAAVRRSFLMAPLPGPLDSPPQLVEVEVQFGAASRRGPQRSSNDDHYLIVRVERHEETVLTSLPEGDIPRLVVDNAYGMALADGMGPAGEAASRLAVATLMRRAIDFGKWHVRVSAPIADEMMDRAARFYRNIDSTLLQASYNSQCRLQTTLTAVYSAGRELFFAHVGHSRAYLFRNNQLVQLTRDHTLEGERQGRPRIVEVSASTTDHHHIVTETLGVASAVALRFDIERCGLADGDLILLCSNGLTDVVGDPQIATALRTHDTPDHQSHALANLAADAGGADDVTALVAQYRIRARADANGVSHGS